MNIGQQALFRNQRGVNPQFQALIGTLGDTQVLDHVAKVVGLLDVFRSNP